MTDLLTGTVTFLFTDIESSTELLKRLGKRYGEVTCSPSVLTVQAASLCRSSQV
jgi:hypothetical protein